MLEYSNSLFKWNKNDSKFDVSCVPYMCLNFDKLLKKIINWFTRVRLVSLGFSKKSLTQDKNQLQFMK